MHHKLFPVFTALFIFSFYSLFAQNDQEQVLYNLGEQFYAGKQFDKSLEIFTELNSKYPKNPTYFDRYWRSLYETGKYDEAHSELEKQYKLKQNDGLILEMAKISITSAKQERAEQEWNMLIAKYPDNFSMIRTVAASMIQLKQYDLAANLYKSKRTEKTPTLFSQELANLYTSTFVSEKAAVEYLNLLIENPNQDGFIEGRINQYFSDSLQSAKILAVFERANPEKYPTSFYRLKGNLQRNVGKFSSAFSSFLKYDKLNSNQGNTSFSFFVSNVENLSADSLSLYSKQFKTDFPASRYFGNMELRIAQILFDLMSSHPDYFEKIESIYLTHISQSDASSFTDLYLKSILKSTFSPEQKKTKIQGIIKTGKTANNDYWIWVVKILNEEYADALKLFEKPGMKSSFAWEYVQTSLAEGISIDSLRWQLLTYSSDFKNREVPKYLFLLIQSVPLPNLNFSVYQDFAKASVQKVIFQNTKAEMQFRLISENQSDKVLAVMAKSELVSLLIESGKNSEINSLYEQIKTSKNDMPIHDEVLFKLGTYFVNQKNFLNAKICFELLIENSPASPFVSLSRNQLNEIRKKISS